MKARMETGLELFVSPRCLLAASWEPVATVNRVSRPKPPNSQLDVKPILAWNTSSPHSFGHSKWALIMLNDFEMTSSIDM